MLEIGTWKLTNSILTLIQAFCIMINRRQNVHVWSISINLVIRRTRTKAVLAILIFYLPLNVNHCGCPNLEQLHSKGTRNCYFFIILGYTKMRRLRLFWSKFDTCRLIVQYSDNISIYLLTEWNRTRSLDHRGKGYPSLSRNVYCSDLDLVVYIAIMS